MKPISSLTRYMFGGYAAVAILAGCSAGASQSSFIAKQRQWKFDILLSKNLAGACVRGRIQMTTVRQLLDQKGGNTWSIHPDATVFDAVAKMAEKDIGSLVVMEGDEFVGIITERHYARNVVLKGKTSPATAVRDIMERRFVIARPEQSVDQCMALMTEKRVRHLPVFEGKKLIGIVSIGDLVKSTIGDQKFLIDQLEHYIRR